MEFDILSATADPDAQVARLLEESKQWPTRENVISRLEAIIASANPGDFVYVHFSGHGTQLPPLSGEGQKHRSTRGLALVLIGGPDGKSIRYFHGLELAYYLKKMVSKGLKVNMVLDCCFSGSVPRGEQDASRFLPYDSTVDKVATTSPGAILDESYAEPDSRDGSLLPNWMVNPDGYTILTACGPHETAMEVKLANQQHAGALSQYPTTYTLESGQCRRQNGRSVSVRLYEICRPPSISRLAANADVLWKHESLLLWSAQDYF